MYMHKYDVITTEKVSRYQVCMGMSQRRELDMSNDRIPRKTFYTSRRKNPILGKRHVHSDYRMKDKLRQECVSCAYRSQRWGNKETSSNVSSSTFLYYYHYPWLVENSGERCMYHSMLREYYWLHITNTVFTSVKDYGKCPHNKRVDWWRCVLQSVRATSLLEFVGMEIIWRLPETLNSIQFVLSMKDSYSKLTRHYRCVRQLHRILNYFNGKLDNSIWNTYAWVDE